MGDWEQVTPVIWESPLGYHPWYVGILTGGHKLVTGQCQADSLTGAVASERVSEALKGLLSMAGNHALECKRRSQPNCDTDGWSSNESWS